MSPPHGCAKKHGGRIYGKMEARARGKETARIQMGRKMGKKASRRLEPLKITGMNAVYRQLGENSKEPRLGRGKTLAKENAAEPWKAFHLPVRCGKRE